jgi:predicted dehydrogenase
MLLNWYFMKTKISKIFNVLIIGAGSIGALRDAPNSEKILSHAHAFLGCNGFNLIGFLDIDKGKAEYAANLWGGRAFSSYEVVFSVYKIDVVIVAVPDDFHYLVLKQISQFPIKFVFAEKPFTKNVNEAKEIITLYRNKGISIAVNHSRRFVPEFEKIKNEISSGLYGEYLSGTGYYGKGILHNGSHMIDFLMYFLGEVKSKSIVCGDYDFYDDDPSVAAVLWFKNNRPFYLQTIDCKLHTTFEVDFMFEKKRIRIVDFGMKIELYDILDNSIFKGHRNAVKVDEIETSHDKNMYFAAKNIYGYLSKNEKLSCTAHDAYKVMCECCELKDMFQTRHDFNRSIKESECSI